MDNKKIPTKNIVFLIISLFNALILLPFVFQFGLIIIIFSAFFDSESSIILFVICLIYALISLLVVPISVWSVLKYNNTAKKVFLLGLLTVILLVVGLFGVQKLYNVLYPNGKAIESTAKNNNIKIEDDLVFSNDDVEIKVKKAFFDKNYINISFILNNKSDKYYNFDIVKTKVNGINMVFGKDSLSNFAYVNKWVNPGESSSNYRAYLWYNDLNKKGFNKSNIKEIAFQIVLYESDDGVFENKNIDIDDYSIIRIVKD